MRQSFITFRSHPNEKYLDEEFLTLLNPMLEKSIKYIVSYESENTIDSHYHIIMFHEAEKFDITNLKSKFNTKSWKNWFAHIKPLHTTISPGFLDQGLQLKLIGTSQEDYLHTLGYVCKENVKRSKNFDEQEITDAVKYYHISSRKPQKLENTWKIITTKNAHATLEDFSKKNEIPYSDKTFPVLLAQNKISMINLSGKQRDQLYMELMVANNDYGSDFNQNYLETCLQEDNHYYYLTLRNKYKRLLQICELQDVNIPEDLYEL